jgi:inner membrane protein COX18
MTWLGEKLGLDRFLDKLEPGTSSLTDTSLAEGGILWFTDLMAADPYGGLPLLCALGLGWSSWSRLDAERLRELLSLDSKTTTARQRLSRGLGRAFLIIPLFPLLFWNLPSAIFLYWAPTFLFNGLNDRLVKAWLPDRQARYTMPKTKYVKRHVGIEGYDIPSKKEVQGAKVLGRRS